MEVAQIDPGQTQCISLLALWHRYPCARIKQGSPLAFNDNKWEQLTRKMGASF